MTAKIPHYANRIRTIAANNTSYWPWGIGSLGNFGSAGEASCQDIIRNPGTATGLRVYVTANTLTTTATTVRSRKNTANGGMTVTIGAGLTGLFIDASGSDSLSAADLYGLQSVTSATGTNITVISIGCDFEATSDLVLRICASETSAAPGTSVTRYGALDGNVYDITPSTEAQTQNKFGVAGTLENHKYRAQATNTRTTTSTYGTRKSGANGNLLVTIGAGVVSTNLEDTTHSDTVAVDDLWGFRLTVGSGTGTLYVGTQHITFRTTGSSTWLPGAVLTAALPTISAAQTRYIFLTGYPEQSATEAQVRQRVRQACTITKFRIYIGTNTITATTTCTFFKNGSSTGASFTIASSATGWFEWSGSIALAIDDEISLEVAAGATGTAIGPRLTGAQFEFASDQTLSGVAAAGNVATTTGTLTPGSVTLNGVAAAATVAATTGTLAATATLSGVAVINITTATTGTLSATATLNGVAVVRVTAATTGTLSATATLAGVAIVRITAATTGTLTGLSTLAGASAAGAPAATTGTLTGTAIGNLSGVSAAVAVAATTGALTGAAFLSGSPATGVPAVTTGLLALLGAPQTINGLARASASAATTGALSAVPGDTLAGIAAAGATGATTGTLLGLSTLAGIPAARPWAATAGLLSLAGAPQTISGIAAAVPATATTGALGASATLSGSPATAAPATHAGTLTVGFGITGTPATAAPAATTGTLTLTSILAGTSALAATAVTTGRINAANLLSGFAATRLWIATTGVLILGIVPPAQILDSAGTTPVLDTDTGGVRIDTSGSDNALETVTGGVVVGAARGNNILNTSG